MLVKDFYPFDFKIVSRDTLFINSIELLEKRQLASYQKLYTH